MKIFGETLGEYVRFQKTFLIPPSGDEGHVAFGTGIGSPISRAISSLVMWIATLATRRSASATP